MSNMMYKKIRTEVQRDTFLIDDPIAPFENHEVEKTESEREMLCQEMLDIMRHPAPLSDDMEKSLDHHVKTFSLPGQQ